jgi:hypothetical protein
MPTSDGCRDARATDDAIRHGSRADRDPMGHLVGEADTESVLEDDELPPKAWERMPDGRPMPNVVRAIRLARLGR